MSIAVNSIVSFGITSIFVRHEAFLRSEFRLKKCISKVFSIICGEAFECDDITGLYEGFVK